MNKVKKQPWFDKNGNILSDDELKLVSRNWSAKNMGILFKEKTSMLV